MELIKNKACPVVIFIFTCILSCSNREKEMPIEITSVYVNYFENDSIQKQIDYYPLRFYIHLQLINKTKNKLYVPIQNAGDTLIQSKININQLHGIDDSKVRYVSIKDYLINPKDTMHISLDISFSKSWAMSANKDSIEKIINELDISYVQCKNEISQQDVRVPKIVIKKSTRLQINYRDETSKDEMIEWI